MAEKKESPYLSHIFVCTNDRGGERKSCADNESRLVRSIDFQIINCTRPEGGRRIVILRRPITQ